MVLIKTISLLKNTLRKNQCAQLQLWSGQKNASAVANQLNTYIDSLKNTLIQRTGGLSKDGDYEGRENVDEGNRLMIEGQKAKELKDKINETKAKLNSMLDPQDRGSVSFALEADDSKTGEKKSWEQNYFGDGVPMGAEMTTLIKIQSDVKNDEAQIQKKLLSKFDQAVVNLDKFNAVAVAKTSYVLVGQPYTADVFLTASDSKAKPDITVGGSPLPIQDGQGKYVGSTSSEGIKTWTATIKVKQTDGTFKSYTTPTQTYQVAKPSAVVSPDKMNVLYIGVDNPLSVSAPGVPLDKLHINMSNGSYSGSKGKYLAKVSTIGTTKITISAEDDQHKTSILGSSEFRVKRIPDPKAQFGGKSGGATSTVNLRAQDRLFAHLDNFEFEAKFNITHFKMLIMKPRQDVIIINGTGSELNAQMKSALNSITPGTKLIFDDVTAVGPDGSTRGLDPIILTAN